MEKIVNIEEREIKLKTHGNITNMYEKQFGEDMFVQMQKMDNEGVKLSLFNNFLWVCAKAANKDILPPDEWNESFETMPVLSVMEEIEELFTKMMPVGKFPMKQTRRRKA